MGVGLDGAGEALGVAVQTWLVKSKSCGLFATHCCKRSRSALEPCQCHPCKPQETDGGKEGQNSVFQLANSAALRVWVQPHDRAIRAKNRGLKITEKQDLQCCCWLLHVHWRHSHRCLHPRQGVVLSRRGCGLQWRVSWPSSAHCFLAARWTPPPSGWNGTSPAHGYRPPWH